MTPFAPMQADAAALVLGLDSHGLALARALSRAGVPVYALEKDRLAPGIRSRHVQRVFELIGRDDSALLPALRRIRQVLPHAQVSLHATNDRQVQLLARHADTLAPDYRLPWWDATQGVLALLHKDGLQAHCERQGLNYPRSMLLRQSADLPGALPWRFPLVVKPVQPLSSFKAVVIRQLDELPPLMARHAQALPFLLQEYIEGGDEALHFAALLLDQGALVHGLVGRKLASYPPALGQTTAAQTTHEPALLALAARFFAGTGLSGPASVEFKRDAQGRWWVIEPTVGRTDFWLPLCLGAGLDLPLMAHQQACGLPSRAPDPPAHACWFDTERDPLAYLKHRRQARPRLWGARRLRFSYFSADDWQPWWAALRRQAVKRWDRWQDAPPGTGDKGLARQQKA